MTGRRSRSRCPRLPCGTTTSVPVPLFVESAAKGRGQGIAEPQTRVPAPAATRLPLTLERPAGADESADAAVAQDQIAGDGKISAGEIHRPAGRSGRIAADRQPWRAADDDVAGTGDVQHAIALQRHGQPAGGRERPAAGVIDALGRAELRRSSSGRRP